MTPQSHRHHYVPQWYQKRFLPPGQSRFFYLDLHPETITNERVTYTRRDLLRWGPDKCFYKDDLYTLNFPRWSTDQIEKVFFGDIDRNGQAAA